jgi:hypothetical protein
MLPILLRSFTQRAESTMAGIFISYRRSDAQGWAGRFSDSLTTELGRTTIFRDIDTIPPGVEFDAFISEAVGSCDVLIALIGPTWLTASESGKRRLDDPHDFTRMEIVAALRRNIRVIPALVGGARMPRPDELPDDLKPLARRNAYELTDRRWADDCRELVEVLRPLVKKPDVVPPPAVKKPPVERQIWRSIVAAAIVILVLVIAGYGFTVWNNARYRTVDGGANTPVTRAMSASGAPSSLPPVEIQVLQASAGRTPDVTVNRLRQAQQSFNEAAAAESRLWADAGSRVPITSDISIRNGYASALLTLDNLEAKDVEHLKQERLWGEALVLKAFAQWRLGLLDGARDTARGVQKAEADQVRPRERALLLALPGLIKTDEAFATLQRVPAEATAAQRESTFRNVQLLVADAVDAIDRGRTALDAVDPMHVYLIEANLATLHDLQVAHERLGEGDARTLPSRQRIKVQQLLHDLRCLSGGFASNRVSYWSNAFTIVPAPGGC